MRSGVEILVPGRLSYCPGLELTLCYFELEKRTGPPARQPPPPGRAVRMLLGKLPANGIPKT